MPSACVDVIILSRQGVLLVWRDNEPAKDQWWLPGGWVLKGELLAECAVRKAREEVGLDCTFVRIIHVDETIFDTVPMALCACECQMTETGGWPACASRMKPSRLFRRSSLYVGQNPGAGVLGEAADPLSRKLFLLRRDLIPLFIFDLLHYFT
jgi:ADP-ribose pyrophosphatase YjhB (NUDIX family)